MITGINHHSIAVSDIDKSIAFYRDTLGLKLLYTEYFEGETLSKGVGVKNAAMKLAVLQAGKDTLELIEYTSPRGKPYDRLPCDIGIMHIAFQVNDVYKMYDELTKKGVKFNNPPVENTEGPMKGMIWCYFSDPDGAQLELVEQR
jgi:catechol 2,3-dioxygenase-like lactoylglutathione lyase family enzyme